MSSVFGFMGLFIIVSQCGFCVGAVRPIKEARNYHLRNKSSLQRVVLSKRKKRKSPTTARLYQIGPFLGAQTTAASPDTLSVF
ncbi:MAG: hypothetical protein EB120_13185 [Proteobacteria bacterium]|nr:hypothetical protein [Pseudomonadota bacterium]NDG28113.1 hypothetical protein [Pseudomonadota bacterium]